MIPYEIYLVRNEFRVEEPVTYLSAVIRGVTGGHYNHIAIHVNGIVYEAVGRGVVDTNYAEWYAHTTRKVQVMHPEAPMSFAQYTWLTGILGTKYGKGDMLRAGAWYVIEKRWGIEIGEPFNGKGYICSEIACVLLGVDWFIVPHEFETLPGLRKGIVFRTEVGQPPKLVHA